MCTCAMKTGCKNYIKFLCEAALLRLDERWFNHRAIAKSGFKKIIEEIDESCEDRHRDWVLDNPYLMVAMNENDIIENVRLLQEAWIRKGPLDPTALNLLMGVVVKLSYEVGRDKLEKVKKE